MAASPVVTVTAPSRLHFGLFAFGRGSERAYGGAGMMIAEPATTVRATGSQHWDAKGPARVQRVAEKLVERGLVPAAPACRLEVVSSPPAHMGLGSGTQFALTTATALLRFSGREIPDATAIASALGRGSRSAIGTYGFTHGGFLVDAGKGSGDAVAPLAGRAEAPAEWRVLLLSPQAGQGMHGRAEQSAFDRVASVPSNVTRSLRAMAMEEMLPAAHAGDFAQFSQSLFRFNRLAGECFAAVQGGPYASPAAAGWVARLRRLGIAGVGQSSWGPAVFAFCQDETEAERIARSIADDARGAGCDVLITRPQNRGAAVECHGSP